MKSNKEIAKTLNDFSDLLEAAGDNPYRIRSYRRAAHVILNFTQPLATLVEENVDITYLPWIGKGIAKIIIQLITTNTSPILKLNKEKKSINELIEISGLGKKRIGILNKEYNIRTKSELAKAIQSKRLVGLKWINKKIMDQVLTKNVEQKSRRFIRLYHAMPIIELLINKLKNLPGIKHIEPAGALRRKQETFEQIDIIIQADNPSKIMEEFISFAEVADIFCKEEYLIRVNLWSGMKVNLNFISQPAFGTSLIYLTGSKAHISQLQQVAKFKKYTLTPNGLFKNRQYIAGENEVEVYHTLDLPFIEPELREGTLELIEAKNNTLPQLITSNDIKGDLHSHTKETDGTETLEIMAKTAEEHGYEYFAITDHSKNLTITHGMDEKRLLNQIKQIDKLNCRMDKILILKSIEVDILEDGSLDLSNDLLKELDIVLCSIHSKFKLSEQLQTERILRAMENPYFNILGHPTGRLIKSRPPYALNMEKILEAAKNNGCFLELNCQPYRLDLNDTYCRMAKEKGVKIAISSDAHSVRGLDFMQWGIYQARRGWLEKQDVINTYSWPDLKKLLRQH